MKKIIACTLAVLAALYVCGQQVPDSVKVYFTIGQWQFEPALDGNAASMDAFINRVRMAADAQKLDHIEVSGYSSPDGPAGFNERLSVERCHTIAWLIVDRTGISRDLVETMPQGIGWNELRSMVAADPEVPSRDKILDILDNTPVSVFDAKGRLIDGRKKQLMDLRGGRPYNWMREHLFPRLRSAVAVALYLKDDAQQATAVETTEITESMQVADREETEVATEIMVEQPGGQEASMAQDGSADLAIAADENTSFAMAQDGSAQVDDASPYHRFALKTNLLYYGALLPNLELEWFITRHWSVAVEGHLAAWGSYRHEKSYRLTLLDAEGKYWIKPRAPWHGMYVGVIAGGGWYDLENGSPGHYGWGVMSGVTFGYMWPISRCLSLEAEIGAGYMHTRYKDYKPMDGHHVYQRTQELNYFGPIKLGFTLAWRFLEVNKPKQATAAL